MFPQAEMLLVAVNNTRVAVIDFLGIYLRDTIYMDAPLPRWYPHFLRWRFVCDYLTNTIKGSKIPKDSIHRRILGYGDSQEIVRLDDEGVFSERPAIAEIIRIMKLQLKLGFVTSLRD